MDMRPLELEPGAIVSSTTPAGESAYFEVTEPLGAGGAGIVYAAFSDEGRPAVIKGPLMVGARDPSLDREHRLLSELPPHPTLVELLGVQRDPRGHNLIILERAFENPFKRLNTVEVRARLEEVSDRRVPLPAPAALELAYELALALEHLHRHKVAHCDVKPENLLLRLDWPGDEIPDHEYFNAIASGHWRGVLIDLGGARTFTELREATAGAPGAELPALTPIYAGPEVLPGLFSQELGRERSQFTPWLDTYAFGLTLYQLLTGWLPYEHLTAPPDPSSLASVAETKREERDGAFLAISKDAIDGIDWAECRVEPDADGDYADGPALSAKLWSLLTRCLYFDPAKRPTIKAVRLELKLLLRVEACEADRPARRDWVQRRLVLNAFQNRLTQARQDGTRTSRAKLENIRRGGSDFWEMQGYRPT